MAKDYASLELRFAKEPGADLYVTKAAELFGVAVSDVTPEQRRYAKTVMYSELYTTEVLCKNTTS